MKFWNFLLELITRLKIINVFPVWSMCRCMVVCAVSEPWLLRHLFLTRMRVSVSVDCQFQNASKCCQRLQAVKNHCQKVFSGCSAPVKCPPKVKSNNCRANGPIVLHYHNTLSHCWTIYQTHCIQCRNFQLLSPHSTMIANSPRHTVMWVFFNLYYVTGICFDRDNYTIII